MRAPKLSRYAWLIVTLLVMAVLLAAATGCGNGSSSRPEALKSALSATATARAAKPTVVFSETTVARSPVPTPTLSATKSPQGDAIVMRPGTNVGTYRAQRLSIATPTDTMRVVGRITLAGGDRRAMLVTNYLEPFCYPPLAGPNTCQPLPEAVRKQFGLQYQGWWVGDYAIVSSGEEWVWEHKKPPVPPGQPYVSFDGADIYIFVQTDTGGDLPPSIKFENVDATFGQTVRIPDVTLPAVPQEQLTTWLLFPRR